MARITTTIWDLASAIYDQAEATATTTDETEQVACAVLAFALDHAVLCGPTAEKRPSLRVRRRALGLTA